MSNNDSVFSVCRSGLWDMRAHWRGLLALVIGAACLALPMGAADAPRPTLMPAPAEYRPAGGRLSLDKTLSIAITKYDDARLRGGLAWALKRGEERTGLTFAHTADGRYVVAPASAAKTATLVIDCAAAGESIPQLGEDESYSLTISSKQAVLRAPTVLGVLRGLETVLQLVQSDATGWFLPAAVVHDQPRFPWRGLMIDVCRHWQPMEVILRNLDGMALVKLNVLHLHLTEDQGFRIESKKFPRLHELGSDGKFFTQEQMRQIIAYAAARGIRVVPEFDIPGHATSWVVGHPELASGPGPYAIERRWGVFDPVLDPTNEKTYELLDGFLGEMAALFPDPYLHIGGDENNGKQWNANPRIQAFIREHDLKNNEGLHAYFNQRVRDILQRHGKKLVGWDEILHPDLPKDSIIHSWRGAKGLADAARAGFSTILSNGYYIDLCHPASAHYLNDPLPENTTLTPEEQKRILGGEATMWAEWVTPETIDSRIWPRTAAIAERLWSPRDVNNVADMYHRLAYVSRRLEEAGLQHERNRPAMIRRLAGDRATEDMVRQLTVLIDAVEPVKNYQRGRQQPGSTQFTPLTGLVDCARPESDAARVFGERVRWALFPPPEMSMDWTNAVRDQLVSWRTAADYIASHSSLASPRVAGEAAPAAAALAHACTVGLDAWQRLKDHAAADETWRRAALDRLDADGKPHRAVELPMTRSVRLLVAAAALQAERTSLAPAEWQRRVEELATPPAPPAKAPH